MRAMILAAGYGTRLWPLTIDRAKPAIPFLGRPLVGYVAEYLAGHGFQEVAVNLHHQPQSVREALGDGSRFGVRLHYIEEPEILGTSGAIDNARGFLEDSGEFLVINGKIVTDIDITAALRTHRETKALATLVLKRNPARERFSTIETAGNLITGFGGMPPVPDSSRSEAENAAPLMFTGIQILDSRIFSYIPRGRFSHSVTDVYLPAIARGERIAAHISDGQWYELSTIPRYLEISLALLGRQGRDTEIGQNSEVRPGADVRETLVWEDARIEPGARVRRAVIGRGVHISASDDVTNAAVVRMEIVREAEIPPKALSGERRGDNFVVPLAE